MRKERPYRQFEAFRNADRRSNLADFLKLSDLKISGVYISRFIPDYRIVGVISPSRRRGMIIKEKELNKVQDQQPIELSNAEIVNANIEMIREAFTQAHITL